jgi:hypothetical protein
MITDYAYCIADKECIHRFACRRWVYNYPFREAEEWSEGRTNMIDMKACLNEDELITDGIDSCGEPYSYGFRFLDRFRNSDERD